MKGIRILVPIILSVLAGQPFQVAAQTETNLYSFAGPPSDGAYPYAALVQGRDGSFYGTTESGGAAYAGTVFRIDSNGCYTNLYLFAGSAANDGSGPLARLAQGSDGNFYGTTGNGGTNGNGTVFRISPSGSYTNLYYFGGAPNDGANPNAGLIQACDGNFYGTTQSGGSSTNCSTGCGTVFRISSGGCYTNLYSFAGAPADGAYPYTLLQGFDGNFYGTTSNGGTNDSGTVFQISPSGSETSLWVFGSSPADGAYPFAGLAQGVDGNFYGTTFYGGTNSNGTVFRISPGGSCTILYSFGNSPSDGVNPFAALLQGSDGNLYGTTGYGGTNGNGTAFQISPGGIETILWSFGSSLSDGANPFAGLTQGSDGNFYGTTFSGGTNSEGAVFQLIVPLALPPNQISRIKLAGTNIALTVSSVAGETYQLQSGNSLTSGWSNVVAVSITNSIGGPLTLTNFGGALLPQQFYRFQITP